jgi:hypothetical protein
MLRVKNWSQFQHYKDRNPLWIKLYISLLDDYEFARLSDAQRGHLILIWTLASKTDGILPNDAKWIGLRIGAKGKVGLSDFVSMGWLEETDNAVAEPRAVTEDGKPWGSRYVPAAMRDAILRRDHHECRKCGADSPLEIDHIIPISAGGESVESNLQVLCRRCNRAKRAGSNEKFATTNQTSAEPRDREETEERREETSPRTRGWTDFEADLPEQYRDAVDGAIRAANNPDALRRELVSLREAITGGQAYTPVQIGQALHELAVAGSRVTSAGLRAFCRRIAQGERITTAPASTEGPAERVLRIAAAQDVAA